MIRLPADFTLWPVISRAVTLLPLPHRLSLADPAGTSVRWHHASERTS